MIVAGVMSGTSADGIDVALVEITDPPNAATTHSALGPKRHPRVSHSTNLQLLHHAHTKFPAAVRRQILAVMNATASVADLARLNFLLGELYAEAVNRAQSHSRIHAELIGCHGQTIYHQGESLRFLSRRIAATWQTGEGAVIAARTGVPVVSDFRVADMAAGGKGAPLVPFLDYLLYRDPEAGRIVQNIGGIANLTAIPGGNHAGLKDHSGRGGLLRNHQSRNYEINVVAFDTGPGNMVIDALAEQLFGKSFDRDGQIATRGTVNQELLKWAVRLPFFRKAPPKSAGREEFGREFVAEFLRRSGQIPKESIITTATALTARSIAEAIRRFVPGRYRDYFASGGGVRNRTLMQMLERELEPLGLPVQTTDQLGLPAEAKEAVAFAVLAHETWHRRPSNVPSATGAGRGAVLGKISFP